MTLIDEMTHIFALTTAGIEYIGITQLKRYFLEKRRALKPKFFQKAFP
jgi:hypothetical protein